MFIVYNLNFSIQTYTTASTLKIEYKNNFNVELPNLSIIQYIFFDIFRDSKENFRKFKFFSFFSLI